MALNDRQLQALKTRVHQQAQALADSEALAMQNMQYAAELEQQLNSCQVMLTSQEAVTAELEALKAQLESSQQQLQQAEHLESQVLQLESEREHLQQKWDSAQQRCQQLEIAANTVAKLQSIAATLRDERDELVQKLEQAKSSVTAAQSQTSTVQQLQQQLHTVAEERDVLARRLDQTQKEFLAGLEGEPSEQVKEAQRRQEVAEAHHYVLKRQYETLQERVKELEQECAQAHAHSQECDRDMAEMERSKLDQQDRIDQLQARNQSLQACIDNLQAGETQTISGGGAGLPAVAQAGTKPDNTKQVLQQELAALRTENQSLQEQLERQDPPTNLEPIASSESSEDLMVEPPLSAEIFSRPGLSTESLLPSIPPLDLTGRTGERNRKFDRRVLNLAAASAESIPAAVTSSTSSRTYTSSRSKEVDLPSFVRGR